MNENNFRGLLPPLPDEQYAALKADICAKGVLMPIECDEAGAIIDGYGRKQACEELGIWNPPYKKRYGLTEDQKIELRLSLNFNRRHVSKIQLKKLATKLRGMGWTQESIAASLGVNQRTISNWLEEFRKNSELAVVIGKDGKKYPATRSEQLNRDSFKEETNAGPGIKSLLNQLRECGRQVEERSIDLILTHLPGDYPDLWRELAILGERILKPGKLIVLRTGQQHLPELIRAFSKRLEYVWTGALIDVHNELKLVLFFAVPPYQCGPGFADHFIDDSTDWSDGMESSVIEQVTSPGDLIVDPFGNPNVTIAAAKLNRQLIGIAKTSVEVMSELTVETLVQIPTPSIWRNFSARLATLFNKVCGVIRSHQSHGSQPTNHQDEDRNDLLSCRLE